MADNNRERAHELYALGYTSGEISAELGIPAGTIRRWKHESSPVGIAAKQAKHAKQKDRKARKKIARSTAEILESTDYDLSDQQKRFAEEYVANGGNGVAACRAAGYSHNGNSTRMLHRPEIQRIIKDLQQSRLDAVALTREDVFLRMVMLAFSDLSNVAHFNGNRLELYDSSVIDTYAVSEVRCGKDGPYIKMYDKMEALKWLLNYIDKTQDTKDDTLAELLKGLSDYANRPDK